MELVLKHIRKFSVHLVLIPIELKTNVIAYYFCRLKDKKNIINKIIYGGFFKTICLLQDIEFLILIKKYNIWDKLFLSLNHSTQMNQESAQIPIQIQIRYSLSTKINISPQFWYSFSFNSPYHYYPAELSSTGCRRIAAELVTSKSEQKILKLTSIAERKSC